MTLMKGVNISKCGITWERILIEYVNRRTGVWTWGMVLIEDFDKRTWLKPVIEAVNRVFIYVEHNVKCEWTNLRQENKLRMWVFILFSCKAFIYYVCFDSRDQQRSHACGHNHTRTSNPARTVSDNGASSFCVSLSVQVSVSKTFIILH